MAFERLLVVALGALVALPAFAQEEPEDETRSAARQMARDGLVLMNEGKYEAAEDLLRRAYELVPAPTVALLRGRALEKLDRLIEAVEAFEAARRLDPDDEAPAAFRQAAKEARSELRAIRGQVPQLTVVVQGVEADHPALEVKLDDRAVPRQLVGVRRPVDPGQHLVLASLDDTVHDTRWIKLDRGEHVRVLLRVEAPKGQPPPPPPPAPQPEHTLRWPMGWAGVGVGIAGLGIGLGAGVAMLGHKSELDEQCRPTCPDGLERELDAFRRARMISAVSYSVGLVGAGVGIVLLATEPSDAPDAEPPAESARLTLEVARLPAGAALGLRGVLR